MSGDFQDDVRWMIAYEEIWIRMMMMMRMIK